jgi:GT2 family glycosyltransferase
MGRHLKSTSIRARRTEIAGGPQQAEPDRSIASTHVRSEALSKVFSRHQGKVSDKWALYLDAYDHILGDLRDRPIRLLEIGVQNGGSLEIWRAYFPNAEAIVGCDVDPRCATLTFGDERIAVVVGDATSDAVERQILSRVPEFDIIIDDGSYRSPDTVRAFARYFRHLSNGGIYIAEDLHCSYWAPFEGGLYQPYSSVSFFKRLVDVAQAEHWGIPRSRGDVLAGFMKKYAVTLDEQDLAAIHSVEFLNSLAVIRKASPESNALGRRRIGGREATVAEEVFTVAGQLSEPPDETHNPWSLDEVTLEEEIMGNRALVAGQKERILALSTELTDPREELTERDRLISERDQEIDRLAADARRRSAEWAAHEAELVRERGDLERLAQDRADEIDRLAAEERRRSAEWTAYEAELVRERGDLERLAQERAAEIERLRSKITEIHASTSWRVTAPIRAVGRSIHRARMLLGRRLTLVPLKQLEKGASRGRATEWTMTGDDPWFALEPLPSRRLMAGYYRLTLSVPAGREALRRPMIYVDRDAGYTEGDRQELTFSAKRPTEASASFSLHWDSKALRFDPSIAPGKVTLGRVRLRHMWRWEHYLRLAAGLARQRIRSRRDLVRYAELAVRILRRGGLSGLAAVLRQGEQRAPDRYDDWIAKYDFAESRDRPALEQAIAALPERPLISVVMPVYNTPEKLLEEAIQSVVGQAYPNWELCIADDCSTAPHVRAVLERWREREPRVKVVYRAQNGHISHATNSAFAMASGEWIALLDHDDLLRPHALAEVAIEIARHPAAAIIYSDEDKIDEQGRRYEPYFKPDFSRELFRSQNYLNHLTVHRAANVRAVGGWRSGFEGSQDYDLNLRIFERIDPANSRHIPKLLYHWRAVAGSTAASGSEKSYAYTAGLRALQEHVARQALPATAEELPNTPFYRLRFSVPDPQPLVSLIIPTRDKADLLRGCIESIRAKTAYRNYEIIVVDNGSTEPDTLSYLEQLTRTGEASVLSYEGPFNFSAINNFAVSKANGAIVGLINNDIEVISPDWLTEMVSWAIQPDVGCVGAKLYYPNDTIQHAGIIVGLGGVAGHSHKYFPREDRGYFFRLKLTQNLSAVTGACLLIRKAVYEEVGGLDDTNLAVAFNDVDLCLKVAGAGYLNVWTPFAELYHLESVSRGAEDAPEKIARFGREIAFMEEHWATRAKRDPFYSPNLTLDREDFSISA